MTLRLIAAIIIFATPLAFSQASVATLASTTEIASTPMQVGGDVLAPKLISSPEPKYPRPLFHKPKASIVLVGLVVLPDGTTTNVHIVKSGGDTFDKSALNAVQQYRFQPATLRGKPVSVQLNVEVQFKIF
ncbi:TonB family protein [Edaphobacter aggregans]|uniref:TonB family protein n=1 Tax=Edaphobacter aggregans TaxID=570835 RepID=A0A428MIJ6_9BACT|nr:energy transducer TonB [Edaphobacter aggregans]RSL16696.1 TonB family protein [Edaphobacter aggregans]